MCDYAGIIKKISFGFVGKIMTSKKRRRALVAVCAAVITFSVIGLHAQAAGDQFDNSAQIKLMISGNSKDVLMMDNSISSPVEKQSAPEQQEKKNGSENLEKRLYDMVGDAPIREMVPFIAQRDSRVAAFLVGIAKKESGWGTHKPVLAGRDCFNYWGFRLKTDSMGSGGHTCFDSPEQAVNIVAARIQQLIDNEKIETPKDMIVWKCGYACENGPVTTSVKKWVSDVGFYYDSLTQNL